LLNAENAGEATEVYRAELEDHPNNGWSLLGLRAALDMMGQTEDDVNAAFDASWARSDTWIRVSRF